MNNPKTIKGYISILKKLNTMSPSLLKGFDSLTLEQQENVMTITVTISNELAEIEDFTSLVNE